MKMLLLQFFTIFYTVKGNGRGVKGKEGRKGKVIKMVKEEEE